MNKQQLISNIRAKKSFLCVGLDTDLKKIPAHLLQTEDPIFAFNKAIIDAILAILLQCMHVHFSKKWTLIR